ncbi:MAG: class I SAM-dependent methyltransferase [Terracidiphilus sp.]|nr:class I SAM-dependent methyltransferase [Terracidiphilus sp.]MDR3777353.1 class I SAM-dependent methyltransferase [Terracidiphilus sp.]
MSIKALLKLIANNQLSALTGSNALLKPFYQLNYVVAAKECGLLELLFDAPKGFEQLAEVYCAADKVNGKTRQALEAWLSLGVRLGFLGLDARGYALKGLAKKLALPQNDAALALLQEAAGLHSNLISHTPGKLRNGELWNLEDQDGEIIARSSRIFEAFQTEVIDRLFPVSGVTSLLEIGCGSGFYIKYAAIRNPSLVGLGLELQPKVADMARRNISEWGLQGRVRIEVGDIRLKAPDECFDIVTLYNNIYYFPVEERVSLLKHIKQFIKPGGFLLLITCCQGGSLGVEVLNLWGAATSTGGRLPSKRELICQLHQAGLQELQTIRLIPGEEFFAFKALSGEDACITINPAVTIS